jgi:hypothetical protein
VTAVAGRRASYGQALALITGVGAALRILLAARQGLGFDEDFTAVAVSHPIGDTLRIVSRDSAPPLFYVLEHAAATIGAAPWNLRLVPVAAGIALIPLLAALARRVAGDAAGLWAAALAAFLPAALFTSTNARMYGLAATLVVAATLLLWRALERPSALRWAGFAVAAGAALWTEYFAAVALAGVMAAALWLRPSRRTYLAAGVVLAAAAATLVPWLAYASGQFGYANQGFWVTPLSPAGIAGTAGQLFAGPLTKAEPPLFYVLLTAQIAAAIVGAIALAALIVRGRSLTPDRARAAIFCLLACGGVVALAAVSIWRPLLEARYAGVMWLPLFALAGAGLALMPRRAASALICAVAVAGTAMSVGVTHSGTTDLLPGIEARVQGHDIVDADPDHYLMLLAEGGPNVVAHLHVLAPADPPWYFGTAAYPAGAVLHAIPTDFVAQHGRIFYVGDQGTSAPTVPADYVVRETDCVSDTCLLIYGPGG